MSLVKRCNWGNYNDQMKEYHDTEWGVPVHDDRLLFEFLTLEGAQAGLSWNTILQKRENFREAFDNFDYNKIAAYGEKKVEELLNNAGIIRNRLKIESTIVNAKVLLKVLEEFGSFDNYIWEFIDNNPIINKFKTLEELPPKTEQSERISKALKKRGFKFVGPTIIYSFMQAVGMINDHTIDCFRYEEINQIIRKSVYIK
ncbi:MAG: DNA-3-methyladenine glycosylase I [Candidatus Lokiarchaeota archaeon]|nr:DNA-3-methyladenine glycosylase I [Candidatus Lokiarchaeota archaeon]